MDRNAIGVALLAGSILLFHLLQRDVFPFAQWNMYVGPGHGRTIYTVFVASDEGPTPVALDEIYPSLDHSRAHAVLRKLIAKSPGGRGPITEWLRALATRWQQDTGRPPLRVEVWASEAAAHRVAATDSPPGRRVLWVDLR
ncbi:MAG: hypothetical protein NXI31_17815 [bacterium]|nr:hypothetical protein [bacterium]